MLAAARFPRPYRSVFQQARIPSLVQDPVLDPFHVREADHPNLRAPGQEHLGQRPLLHQPQERSPIRCRIFLLMFLSNMGSVSFNHSIHVVCVPTSWAASLLGPSARAWLSASLP